MEQLLLIFSNITFLLLGWCLGRQITDKEIGKKVIKEVKDFPAKAAVKAGIIEYVSQEDIDYVESGEDKVDQERERIFKEQFKPHA